MSTPTDTVPYLLPNELAEILRVTPRTLCRWRRAGAGPEFVREGRIIRYRSDVVDSWARATH